LDEPQSWRTTSRWLRLAGWCLHVSGAPITFLRARIGHREFIIPLEISRPDVIDYFGRSPENNRCGFSIDVRMPRGRKLLTVEAQIPKSPWKIILATTVQGPLLTRRGERRRRQERDLAATIQRYRWWYDRPADWGAPTRILYVSGWFIDTMGVPIHGIRARIGRQFFPANINLSREDLLVTYPDLPLARRSGFAVAIPLPRGTSKLVLQYQGTDRVWRDFDFHRVRGAIVRRNYRRRANCRFHRGICFEQRFSLGCIFQIKARSGADCALLVGASLAKAGSEAVRARADRTLGEFGIVRRDVAFAHNNRAGSLHSGFLIHASIPRGRHQLVLRPEMPAGDGNRFSKRPFVDRFLVTAVHRLATKRKFMRIGSLVMNALPQDKHAIKQNINAMSRRPRFSIYFGLRIGSRWLRRAFSRSGGSFIRTGSFIADDASTKSAGWKIGSATPAPMVALKMLRRETRGGIAATSNDALSLATGEFVALLDHDDTLAPEALYLAAVELERNSTLQLIYTDEDKIDEHEQRHSPYFKPEWNPDLFLAQNYVSHLTVLRTDLVRRVAGFRSAFDGSQDYDLLLRCVAQIEPQQIARIARVLYHWRALPQSTAASTSAKNYAHPAAVRAVQFDMEKVKAKVEPASSRFTSAFTIRCPRRIH
jgi:hypothetical protein